MLSFFSLAFLLAASAQPAPACGELAGIDPLLAKPNLDYLLIGEFHGTAEMPGVAADVICHAARTGRPLVVAVEFQHQDQAAFDRYMASDGGTESRKALLASPGWKEEGGRTTAAIADLIETARKIGRRQPVTLVAFDRGPQPAPSPMRDASMAKALEVAASKKRNSLVIAFTGSAHANKKGFVSPTTSFPSAAGHLPQDRTISLSFAQPGGRHWGCYAPNGDTSNGCTAYDMPARQLVAPRGIVLDPKIRSGFDGVYHPGSQYTASRPASGNWR